MSIEGDPMERSGLIIGSEVTVDQLRFLSEKLGDFINFFSFNVPEKVLIGLETIGHTFDGTHFL